ncbi:hypothetical protein [Lacibacter sp.]|uniref:hypothetical protein n=1 Tax=Lacibacter sp. TaxID=1915409 RepID=UPI002B4AEA00|nr:hypothetical protein [Lacibacter sp.]HLP38569.1 hypothetical protein [Lacibacter sp.]
MQTLLHDIEQVVDLSPSETKDLIQAFKLFTDRHFDIDPVVLQQTFSFSSSRMLNQQEDEDNTHSQLEELLYY